MKFLFSLIVLLVAISPLTIHAETLPNLLLIDSSFAPMKTDKFNLENPMCSIISESAKLAEKYGDCFGKDEWKEIQGHDSAILKGMMNTLAGIEGSENSKWKEFNSTNPDVAKKLRNNYILSVHGSRASYIAYNYSGKKAEIFPLRVVTASAGDTKQKEGFKTTVVKKLKEYSKDCPLVNWPKTEVEAFHSKNKLQSYQDSIAQILNENASIKVVSISLGYKKSWIKEDNAKCDAVFVDKEYQVLVDSWNNLLKKFKDRVFIVAAGNEGISFDNAADKNDDLWATLVDNENLILVGSLKKNGERFPSSNYGSKVLMVKGEEIETLSPIPSQSEGYKTTVRGTSFSAPIIAGFAVKILDEKRVLPMKDLRAQLEKAATEVK